MTTWYSASFVRSEYSQSIVREDSTGAESPGLGKMREPTRLPPEP